MDLFQREHLPPNFSRNRGVVWKRWFSALKTRNISETAEDRTKVTINCFYKVVYKVSIGAKMYDLE